MQALETATNNASLFLGLSKNWGRVELGYTDNMVLLNADPLADISNVNKIDSVVVSGQRLAVPNSISCSMSPKYLTLAATLNNDESVE